MGADENGGFNPRKALSASEVHEKGLTEEVSFDRGAATYQSPL